MPHFDDLETRSADARAADQTAGVIAQIARVRAAEGACLPGEAQVTCLEDLPKLPVLRKSDLVRWQTEKPPFGGIPVTNAAHVFQSPGPIYEPGGVSHDWWRMGRFLFAAGIGQEDVVQNCFGYHLTPAGMIFENGARAVGARVLPAGTGQTELQVQAARDVGSTAYAGTPDYLKTILDKADEMGVALKIAKAAVSGGALFPSLRAAYKDRGITCLQCYATADLGNIAYESAAMEGMIVDEGVIVEIVTPGTGDPVARRRGGRGDRHQPEPGLSADPLRHRRHERGAAGAKPLRTHQHAHQGLDGPGRSDHQDQGHVRAPRAGGGPGGASSRNREGAGGGDALRRAGRDDGEDRGGGGRSRGLWGECAGGLETQRRGGNRAARKPAQGRCGDRGPAQIRLGLSRSGLIRVSRGSGHAVVTCSGVADVCCLLC